MKNIGNIKIMNSMDFDNPITIKGYLKELLQRDKRQKVYPL